MLPDRVSNPGPLTYESGALPIALRGPAGKNYVEKQTFDFQEKKRMIFFLFQKFKNLWAIELI